MEPLLLKLLLGRGLPPSAAFISPDERGALGDTVSEIVQSERFSTWQS